jgi:hypothetical protein
MKFKSIVISICVALVLLCSYGVYTTVNNHNHNKSNTIIMRADDAVKFKDIKEIYSFSDVILVGEITSVRYDTLNGVPFTYQDIKVNSILNGQLPYESIVIRTTGGKIGDTIYQQEDEKSLQTGNKYLLMLKKVYPNKPESNEYTPCNFESIFQVEGTIPENFRLKGFNSNNPFEGNIVGKKVNDIIENIK